MMVHRHAAADPLVGDMVQAVDVLPNDPCLVPFRQQIIHCQGPKFDLVAVCTPQPRPTAAEGPLGRRTFLWQREQHSLPRIVVRWSAMVIVSQALTPPFDILPPLRLH
ncbi:MAG: hypothetical protein HQ567_00815 [Candidatus Nealsonbacteria bacterium]|nr:hypothetical protein [Candidatus Nealsonbacteria bacterium]